MGNSQVIFDLFMLLEHTFYLIYVRLIADLFSGMDAGCMDAGCEDEPMLG